MILLLTWGACQFLENFFPPKFLIFFFPHSQLHLFAYDKAEAQTAHLLGDTNANQEEYFLSLYKCVQGCTWKLTCPIHPPSIHVLAEAWGSCTLCSAVKHSCVISPPPCWDWNPSTSHHLWTKVTCSCSSLLLVPPAVHWVICRGRGEIKLAYRPHCFCQYPNVQKFERDRIFWKQGWVLNGVYFPDLGGRSMKLSPSNNVVSHDGIKSMTPPSAPCMEWCCVQPPLWGCCTIPSTVTLGRYWLCTLHSPLASFSLRAVHAEAKMKIEFAPRSVPLQRRLQTAAVAQWVCSFLGLGKRHLSFLYLRSQRRFP